MINDWIISRCKLERLTWELPIESLRIRVRRLSGEKKSAEPGRHNPTLAHYLSFHTRTKGPGSYWHSLDIFQLKCSVCGRAHICCVLPKRLSPPCWRRVTLRGQSAVAGESGRTELLPARSSNRAQSTGGFDGCENKKPCFNCQLVASTGSIHSAEAVVWVEGWKARVQVVQPWRTERFTVRRGREGMGGSTPGISRLTMQRKYSTLISIVSGPDNCFPYKSRHKA